MKTLFEIQKEFTQEFVQEKYGKPISELEGGERLGLIKDYILHLYQELSSILSNTSYKMHRRPREHLIHPNIREEIIDTIKFAMGLWCILGKDWEEFESVFRDKSEVVSWRYKQDKDVERLAHEPVAVLDIDGVLAQYPGPMIEFINRETGGDAKTKEEVIRKYGLLVYEELKEKYRISGAKRTLPLVPGAKAFLEYLRSRGYPIVLVSARPYDKYLNILGDTLAWTKYHGLTFDAIYFDPEKTVRIAKRFPRARLFVDDSVSFVSEICSSYKNLRPGDLDIFLFDSSGTEKPPDGAYSVSSFEAIIRILEGGRDEG